MGRQIHELGAQKSLKLFVRKSKQAQQRKMSKIFSWEYFSFPTLDDGVVYKEVLVVPALILVLSMVWMQLVKGQTESQQKDINFEQAYQDAVLNEVDSGAESQAEEEAEEIVEEIGHLEETEEKAVEEKKED